MSKKMELEIAFKSSNVRVQETKSGKTLVWQRGGYLGADGWDVVFDVFCPSGVAYPIGSYLFNLVLKADQWGSLQVDVFNCEVTPIKG